MAGSDDETLEVGSNQERRLCGLAGDDDVDDLREDAEELFGRNVQVPIILEPCDDQAVDGEENNGKRSCPSTLAVWLDFKKLFKIENAKKVRYVAKCIHCSKEYSGHSSGGTSHLTQHRDNALGGMKKLACLSHRSLLILMVVCAIGSTVLLLLVLNWFDCLLGLMFLSLSENHMHLKNTLELFIILNLFQSLGKPPLETCLNTSLIVGLSLLRLLVLLVLIVCV